MVMCSEHYGRVPYSELKLIADPLFTAAVVYDNADRYSRIPLFEYIFEYKIPLKPPGRVPRTGTCAELR